MLFRAYFAEGRNVNSEEVLAELLGEVGLDKDKALASIKDTTAQREFEEGVEEAMNKGEQTLRLQCQVYSTVFLLTKMRSRTLHKFVTYTFCVSCCTIACVTDSCLYV